MKNDRKERTTAAGPLAIAAAEYRAATNSVALITLESRIAEVTQPGFYGRLELILQDGLVDSLRTERIERTQRPKLAA